MSTTNYYKAQFSFEQRLAESQRILRRYPDKIALICQGKSQKLDKCKYLVSNDFTFGQFQVLIRRKLKLSSEKALFLYLQGNNIPSSSSNLGSLYKEYKDKDGFLYIYYMLENTFGSS